MKTILSRLLNITAVAILGLHAYTLAHPLLFNLAIGYFLLSIILSFTLLPLSVLTVMYVKEIEDKTDKNTAIAIKSINKLKKYIQNRNNSIYVKYISTALSIITLILLAMFGNYWMVAFFTTSGFLMKWHNNIYLKFEE